MLSDAQKMAQKRYAKKTVQFIIRVNPETEPDVYIQLTSVGNRSGYLKSLVKRDIAARQALTAAKAPES